MTHPSSARVVRSLTRTAAAATLLLGARTAAAQPQALDDKWFAVLVSVGAGAAPSLDQVSGVSRQDATGSLGAGLRLRPRRGLLVDLLADVQGTGPRGDDLLIAPLGPYEQYSARVRRAGSFVSSQARVGLERRFAASTGPLLRATVGGGYMAEVAEPFAAAAVGLSTTGPSVRLTLDLEQRMYRLGVSSFEARHTPLGGYQTFYVGGSRVTRGSTFVRLGLELR